MVYMTRVQKSPVLYTSTCSILHGRLQPIDNAHLALLSPPLLCQFCHPLRHLVEADLELRPPSLGIKPLSLQPRPFVVSLLVEIGLDLVPRTQRRQHANAPDQISAATRVQLDLAPVTRRQAGVHLLRLWDLGRADGRRIKQGGQAVVGHGHLVEVERLAALHAARAGAPVGAEETLGPRGRGAGGSRARGHCPPEVGAVGAGQQVVDALADLLGAALAASGAGVADEADVRVRFCG
jgi:hypothetical protein